MFLPESLKDFLINSGISFKENSKSYIFSCPRCNKKDKLYFRKKDGIFICFVCKDSTNFCGVPEEGLSELLNLDINYLKSKLYSNIEDPQFDKVIDITLKDFYDDLKAPADTQFPTTSKCWPLDFYTIDHKYSIKGQEYLLSRGIPLHVAVEYKIKYSPSSRRVIFPVEMNNKLIGWQGRDITNKQKLKSLNSKDFKKAKTLMFYDRIKNNDHVVLTEGPIDCIKAHLCGNNIATMGKGISNTQIDFIKYKNPKSVYIGLDPDAAIEISNLVDKLSDSNCYLLEVPKKYKDLGEMSFEEVFELFKDAKKLNNSKIVIYLQDLQKVL